MTTLYKEMKLDLIEFRLARDTNRTKLLQTLIGELNTQEKNKVVIDDAYVIKTVKLFIKYNSETISKTNDVETKNLLKLENEFLETYLPKMLTEAEVKFIIEDKGLNDLAFGMKYFKQQYNGQYDGKMVSELLKAAQSK